MHWSEKKICCSFNILKAFFFHISIMIKDLITSIFHPTFFTFSVFCLLGEVRGCNVPPFHFLRDHPTRPGVPQTIYSHFHGVGWIVGKLFFGSVSNNYVWTIFLLIQLFLFFPFIIFLQKYTRQWTRVAFTYYHFPILIPFTRFLFMCPLQL